MDTQKKQTEPTKKTPAKVSVAAEEDRLVSATELAGWLCIDIATLSRMAAGVVLRESHGKYFLKQSVQAYCRLKNGKDKSDSRERADLAKAELIEIELAQKRGELLPAEIVAALWDDLALKVRTKIQNLPHKAAPVLADKKQTAPQIKTILEKFTDEALHEIADYDQASIIAREVDKFLGSSPGDVSPADASNG